MAAGRSHDEVVLVLERRFDYLSARYALGDALGAAGIGKKGSYNDEELAAVTGALATLFGRMDEVATLLTGPAPAAKAEPRAEAKAEEKPEPKAEAKAKAEEKPEPKAEAKPEPKAEEQAEAESDDAGKKKKK